MPIRIAWDRYEVALLFNTYEQVVAGSDISVEAKKLSEALRNLATQRGFSIDETFRNVNGMKMQLANVQYLFTEGKKGLSGASAMIRQMYELYRTNQVEFQAILKEAIRLTENNSSVDDAFFAYAKDRTGLSPSMLATCLKNAGEFCLLERSLLGITDVKTVRKAQQKISEGKMLHFRFGKDAQTIRSVTQLYYSFVKSYKEQKDKPSSQATSSQNGITKVGDSCNEPVNLHSQILSVAAECFPNGIRSASIIDLNKLRREYTRHYNMQTQYHRKRY